jgi:hypothetical protein
MKIYKLDEMKSGWFIGDFEPTSFRTNQMEACYRIHPKGEKWDTHYHRYITEINLLISGKMKIQDRILISGDIFVLEPYEIANPEFIEDCSIVCIKYPSIPEDKIIIK